MKKIPNFLKNPMIRKAFSMMPFAFLVGGYPRDAVIGRVNPARPGKAPVDLDFAMPDAEKASAYAKKLAESLGGSFVCLKEGLSWRIVLPNGGTIDVSLQEGEIENDLKRRDFTINSLAWSPKTGILDPFGGMNDIEKGVIRGIGDENFIKDPIRMLRAYRFASELSYEIHPNLRKFIRNKHELIRKSASERITQELFKLLDGKNSHKALSMALSDGLLRDIVPLRPDVLKKNLIIMNVVEKSAKSVPDAGKDIGQGLSRLGFLRLAAVLLGADIEKAHLCLSTQVFKRLTLINRHYQAYKSLKIARIKDMDMLFDLFHSSGDAVFDLIALSGRVKLVPHAHRFLKAMSRPRLSAEEIKLVTGLSDGPGLGLAILYIKRLEFTGRIKNKKEALKEARAMA